MIKFHLIRASQIILTTLLIWLRNTRVGKSHPRTNHEFPEGVIEIFNLGAKCEWMVNAKPRHFYPRERDPLPIVGGLIGPVWPCSENLAPSRSRSPDRPTRRQSQYRLLCRGNPIVKFPSQHLRHVELQQAMFSVSCLNGLRTVLCASRDSSKSCCLQPKYTRLTAFGTVPHQAACFLQELS